MPDLREAAYTSPHGTRITFHYEDVSRETTKRGTAFEFPGVDDAYVQHKGHSSRRYPLRCIFWGEIHDQLATSFEAILLESGIGRLEHPLYGSFDAVPFGDITRRDDLKNEANQTIVEVTFWTTIPALYPQAGQNPQSEILTALDDFDIAQAQRIQDATDLAGALNQSNAKATTKGMVKSTGAALKNSARAGTSVGRTFAGLQNEITIGIDVLITDPATLVAKVTELVRTPARAFVSVRQRLDAYAALAASIFASPAGRPADALVSGTALATRTTQIGNDFHFADVFALSTLAGSVTVATREPLDDAGRIVRGPIFRTKPEALTAAELILAQFDDVVAWRDGCLEALETIPGVHRYQVDTGEAYQAIQSAVALTVGRLIEISFSLVPERRIVLDRPRTIIDLCAELYGEVDDKLDFLIASNQLTGSEILELERGKSILYYPD
jgi:hypothetical protein